MSKFLDGIAVRFYRGIGPDTQFIGPFSRLNFFVGANNAGKSIVLNLLASRLANELKNEASPGLEPIEVHKGRETGEFVIAVGRLGTKFEEQAIAQYRKKNSLGSGLEHRYTDAIRAIARQLDTSGLIWTRRTNGGEDWFYPKPDISSAHTWTDDWNIVWRGLQSGVGGGSAGYWVRESLKILSPLARPGIPIIHLIPAKRELGGKGEAFDDLSGRGLIDHLAGLQNPDYDMT